MAGAMDKKSLSERDICTKFITPALRQAGWDEMAQIREEVSFTKGRIIVRGKLVSRGKGKRADYILYYKPNVPIALIEAKDNARAIGDGMQQGLDHAETLNIPFVFSSNGDGFVFHDRTGAGAERETTLGLDAFPPPDDLWARYRACGRTRRRAPGSRSRTVSSPPGGCEVQCLDELVGVAVKHFEIITHVRDVAVRATFLRTRVLGGDDNPLSTVTECVGDEERVTADALHLLVAQISRVAHCRHFGNQLSLDILVEQQCVPVLPQPKREIVVVARKNLFVHLHRDLRLLPCRAVKQPTPELGHPPKGIVVAVRVDQDVGVEQVEQARSPYRAVGGRSILPTCAGLTPRIRATLVVDNAPESIMRWANPSKACPTR